VKALVNMEMNLWVHKILGNTSVVEQLVAYQEGCSSVELVR
jgi:hypothetical protein